MSLEHPNYYDSRDRYVYEQLEREMKIRKLTDVEINFYNTMYRQEEHDSFLDGEY